MTPRTRIVMKFGGSSVADPDKIRHVAGRFAAAKRDGHDVIGTVSAMGKTTDTLLALANDVSPSPDGRELDMLLSTGERIACALVAMAIQDLGYEAVSFTGSQAGILTDSIQGLPARICWLGQGDRARFALALNDLVASGEVSAPIVIGRDHLDTGSVASPFRETEGMRDGSDAIADWAILNALLNTASGASWVSFHHGGGVGIGNSLHAGQVIVADGTERMRRRLERVLTNDPGIGVARHADAGYDDGDRDAERSTESHYPCFKADARMLSSRYQPLARPALPRQVRVAQGATPAGAAELRSDDALQRALRLLRLLEDAVGSEEPRRIRITRRSRGTSSRCW